MEGNTELRIRVTALQKQRGRLYIVTWEDETQSKVYRPTWDEMGYGVGSSMTEEEREALLIRAEEARAKEYALWLLSHRDYAKGELRQKLRRKSTAATAEKISERMGELGLVDDDRYAVRLAQELCVRKHYPRRRAEEVMRQKGIDREVARTALEEVGTEDYEQALALLQKKCYTANNGEEMRRRMRDFLVRYGFSYETAHEAIRMAERE